MEQPIKQETFSSAPLQMNQVLELLKDSSFPRYYANGFVIGRSETDLFIMTVLNGQPTSLFNVNFSAAKKLLEVLKNNIEEVEKTIGEIKSMPKKVKTL